MSHVKVQQQQLEAEFDAATELLLCAREQLSVKKWPAMECAVSAAFFCTNASGTLEFACLSRSFTSPTRSFITHVSCVNLACCFNFHFLCTSFSCLVTSRSPDQMRACIPQPSPAPVVQGKSWKQVADRFNCLFLSACSPFHGCVYISCQPPYKWFHQCNRDLSMIDVARWFWLLRKQGRKIAQMPQRCSISE